MSTTRPWVVGVVVPACDEAATVQPCIASLRLALASSGRAGWIVVVADSCSDSTADAARQALGTDGEVVECRAGTAGRARRVGTDRLLAHLDTSLEDIWIAMTDADGTVPAHWLRTQLRLADTGVVAVAGVVRLAEASGDRVADRHRATYTLHDDGTHPHVHGANLGVRADAYVDVQGWDGVTVGEDHALWGRLRDRGWPIVASIESWVTTSSRRVGRAPNGFAADLAALERAT